MKKIFSLLFSFLFITTGFCQKTNYWQQQVDVSLNVVLIDTANAVTGNIVMDYYNNSPDTLRFIWIHLWPNAYKNDRTAFSDQLLENNRTDFYFSNEDQKGYMNRLNFTVDDVLATVQDHPQHQDIIKLILPLPLAPAKKIIIKTPFQIKLPENFSRGGHINQSYQLTQWYPKPAVYDSKGWHEMPYLDQGEFYSEFGNYSVTIKLPANYVVAATGKLVNEIIETPVNSIPVINPITTKIKSDTPLSAPNYKTITYQQNNIHDFAWFADKNFEILHDTLQLHGKVIDVYAYYNKNNKKYWTNSIRYIKAAVLTKSKWLGEYPYPVVSVVEKAGTPDGGGMEYPTITLISKTTDEQVLDYLINHEVGHNWFYGIIANNEREHPWMDEGMNSFYDSRYFKLHYGISAPPFLDTKSAFMKKREPNSIDATLLETVIGIKKDQPIETSSEKFSESNYGLIAYTKAAEWMQLIEKELGEPLFDSIMQQYCEAYKFKHPYPADFKSIAENISHKNLDSLFGLLSKKGSLSQPVKKDIRINTFFSLKETEKHHYLLIAPAIGYNFYDKPMLGVLLHNYTLPLNKFQFLLAPMYAFGPKEINGLGRVSYSLYPGNDGQKIEIALAGEKFTGDSFTDSSGKVNYQPFTKIAPTIKYTFANKNPRSTQKIFLQWKTYFITETELLFSRDTILNKDIITYPKENRYLNQLQFAIEDNRKLYPYSGTLQVNQGDGFVSANFTGNYFFNYAKGGGVNVRFFAGKFFYTGDKTFLNEYETDRYQLNMTGPNGNEDYTYSNYFIGRNEYEGLPSQQIMIRDGAFKVRTDLLSNKIGKSDNWLTATNITTTIPKKINPLELLPIKIPLKIFLDIGSSSEAWEKDAATPKILYDAGLQLSLFKNIVNIYIPLLYSQVYRDYFNSTSSENTFLKRISFSIDLQNISSKKIFPQIPL